MTNPLANREKRTAHNYALTAQGIREKVCSQCHTQKPHADFNKYKPSSDGLSSWCRACKAADHVRRYTTNPDYRAQMIASGVRWWQKNQARANELRSARKAEQRIRNADRVQDPNVLKRCAGRCQQMLPETEFRLDRGQRDGLRSTCRACTKKCRNLCRKAHGAPEGQCCYLCGDVIASARGAWVDHVVPRSEGGSDEPENLRWTHGGCNMRRGNRPLTAEQSARLYPSPLAA